MYFYQLIKTYLVTQFLECRCGVGVNNEKITKTLPYKIYNYEVEWGGGGEAIIIFTVPSFKLESDIRVYNLQNLVLWPTEKL